MKKLQSKRTTITKKDLENYIYNNIPITAALGIKVDYVSLDKITLFAPLLNNINHKKTAFGGSLHSVATLACWSLLYVNLKNILDCSEVVIAQSNIHYLTPVTADFKAECLMPKAIVWERFLKTLDRMKKARIKLSAHILQYNQLSVDYEGIFVAFR